MLRKLMVVGSYDRYGCTLGCIRNNWTNYSRYFLMDTNHPYWKYAEKVNGRLAMLGLIIGTINYVLFGEIAPGFF